MNDAITPIILNPLPGQSVAEVYISLATMLLGLISIAALIIFVLSFTKFVKNKKIVRIITVVLFFSGWLVIYLINPIS